MTHDRDLERLLDAYLADGAREIPDRVLVDALDRVARTPQQARARIRWRVPTMSTSLRLLMAGLLAAILGASMVPLLAPSPRPPVSPSPTPEPASLPLVLQHHWLAPARDVPAMG